MEIINSTFIDAGFGILSAAFFYAFVLQALLLKSISAILFAHNFQNSTRQKDIQNAMNKIKRHEKKNIYLSFIWPIMVVTLVSRVLKGFVLKYKHPNKG